MEYQTQGPDALRNTSPTEGSPRVFPNNFTECDWLPSEDLVSKPTHLPGSVIVWDPRQETHTALSPVHPANSASAFPTQDEASHAGPTARWSPPLQEHLQASPKAPSQNPLYGWRYFSSYRTKVTRKQVEGEDPIWPTYLEDAFLDAILLVPIMGRKKYSANGILYGRNMLISEYLWISHWLLFPPAVGEIVPVGKAREPKKATKDHPEVPGHPQFRHRKQVSSHIQTLKSFLYKHPACHFFLQQRRGTEGGSQQPRQEKEEIESLKNSPVLAALVQGRLPGVQPNYEYFARLLSADSEVFLRPRSCRIFVSGPAVTQSGDPKQDALPGGRYLAQRTNTWGRTGPERKAANHPSLSTLTDAQQGSPEGWDETPHQLFHNYTEQLSQAESSSIREISRSWACRFPLLWEKLTSALGDAHPSHEGTARSVVGPCDIIHMNVVLNLHHTTQFPEHAKLEGDVRFDLNQPKFVDHVWRCHTSIFKPPELYRHAAPTREGTPMGETLEACKVVEYSNGYAMIQCPFPASNWSDTFHALAQYAGADRRQKRRVDPVGEPSARDQSTKGGPDGNSQHETTPTATQLLEQIAMYQEIWSSPGDGTGMPTWTRRTVILWTFSHSRTVPRKRTFSTVSAGTSWRFLTKLDPVSHEHRDQAYVPRPPRAVGDSARPFDADPQGDSAAPDEEFCSHSEGACGPQIGQIGPLGAHPASATQSESGFRALATPPPSTCLPSNGIAHGSMDHESMDQHLFLSPLSASPEKQIAMVAAPADPLLSSLAGPLSPPFDEPPYGLASQPWRAGMLRCNIRPQPYAHQWVASSFESQPSFAWPLTGAYGDMPASLWDLGGSSQCNPTQLTMPWAEETDAPWYPSDVAVAAGLGGQNTGWGVTSPMEKQHQSPFTADESTWLALGVQQEPSRHFQEYALPSGNRMRDEVDEDGKARDTSGPSRASAASPGALVAGATGMRGSKRPWREYKSPRD